MPEVFKFISRPYSVVDLIDVPVGRLRQLVVVTRGDVLRPF